MNKITLSQQAYRILMELGSRPPEAGCVLGCDISSPGVITEVWIDEGAGAGQSRYAPSGAEIEALVNQWQRTGRRFLGICHSHMPEHPTFSPLDLISGQILLRVNDLPEMVMGLLCRGKLTLWRLRRSDDPSHRPPLEELEIQVLPKA